jgi:hypothetical protein
MAEKVGYLDLSKKSELPMPEASRKIREQCTQCRHKRLCLIRIYIGDVDHMMIGLDEKGKCPSFEDPIRGDN